jgi:hypothetical protein
MDRSGVEPPKRELPGWLSLECKYSKYNAI